MKKRGEVYPLPATHSDPKPADFPLGSVRSRAAARSLLKARDAEKPGVLFRIVGRGIDPNQKCTCKAPPPGTIAFCQCRFVSPDTDREATAGAVSASQIGVSDE